MKATPSISKFMTTCPHTIGPDIDLDKALSMMREYHIRHLPVQKAGELVGVLTDRDIKLAASFNHQQDLRVEDVMTPDPYIVSPHSTLEDVAEEMAEKKYGCAIVVDNRKVVGIFTAVDGLRTLKDVLNQNYKTR